MLPCAAALDEGGDELLPCLHLAFEYAHIDYAVVTNEFSERVHDCRHEVVRQREDVAVTDKSVRLQVVAYAVNEDDCVAVVRDLVAEREDSPWTTTLHACRTHKDAVEGVLHEEQPIGPLFLPQLPLASRQLGTDVRVEPLVNLRVRQVEDGEPIES